MEEEEKVLRLSEALGDAMRAGDYTLAHSLKIRILNLAYGLEEAGKLPPIIREKYGKELDAAKAAAEKYAKSINKNSTR